MITTIKNIDNNSKDNSDDDNSNNSSTDNINNDINIYIYTRDCLGWFFVFSQWDIHLGNLEGISGLFFLVPEANPSIWRICAIWCNMGDMDIPSFVPMVRLCIRVTRSCAGAPEAAWQNFSKRMNPKKQEKLISVVIRFSNSDRAPLFREMLTSHFLSRK